MDVIILRSPETSKPLLKGTQLNCFDKQIKESNENKN